VSWFLARRFVDPIVGLQKAAGRFAEGEADVEVPVSSGDELGHLAASFNRMVSAIRQNTAELKKTAEELKGVSCVILRWDPDSRIRFMNDFGLELFGYGEGELVDRPLVGTIVPPSEDAERNIEAMIKGIVAEPSRYEIDETENVRSDGDRIWMAWRNTPIVAPDGCLQEILTIGIEITERRRIEREIREQKQLLENTIESLPHPFYVIDAEDYSIQIANSVARAMGTSGETTCHALSHKSDAPCNTSKHHCPLVEIKKTSRPCTVEHIHTGADGSPRYFEVNGYPVLDEEGRVVQMIEYSIDISERKTMELNLAAAKEAAESANRAKSTFLANMSHELRTPMNAIIGYSEMLADDAEEEGIVHIVPDLEKINTAGRHLLALINDILDLSKIEAGRMDLYLERFDLRQMLDEAAATVIPLVEKNGNQLETRVSGDLGTIRADLTKVRQALFNLLSNAAKFTENGTITLAARRFQKDNGEWFTLDVSDTGIGIAEDKLEQVFEEFSQADSTTTRDYGGTGLGLPISQRFCRMMGGDITVRSEIGKGSTFTIELPTTVDALEAAKQAAREGREPSPESAAAAKQPILVVDDDENARELLRRMLEAEGFTVATASSGEEGLELARKVSPLLITLDVLMPGMDGWAVLQELKADPALEKIPVMMISIAGDKELGYSLGAIEYLSKPVDRDRLRKIASQFATPAGGGLALVVDDDADIRSMFRRALSDNGWTVAEAENGAVALNRVGEQRPDLVLLDLMMPVMDGFEFVMQFRALEDCAKIPVIVVTAKDLTRDEKEQLLGGVERILAKGALTRAELLDQVRQEVAFRGEADVADSGDLE
jgi:PAS domain S-box-containing protein